MKMPLPKSFHDMKSRLAAFASEHGVDLDEDGALDLASHLMSDVMTRALIEAPADWHRVLWNREIAQTCEMTSLARSQEDALAAVIVDARDAGREIDSVQRQGAQIEAHSEGEVYATIGLVPFESPPLETAQRFETLLAKLSVSDEIGLLKELSSLPAWLVEPDNRMPLWSSMVMPVGTPRAGQWLPRLSVTHGSGRHAIPDTEDLRKDFAARLEREEKAMERNRLPMWVTPQSMAKLLQAMLSERSGGKVKLSACQEALARALGVQSWQVLVAWFTRHVFVQKSERSGEDDGEQDVRFFRSPAELFAGIYDDARRLKAVGKQLHLSVSWIDGTQPSVRWGRLSSQDLRRAIALEVGHPPDELRVQLPYQEETRWREAEDKHRAAAGEWSTPGMGFLGAVLGDERADEEAAALLERCKA
jgi:hypothetical protein